MSRRIVTESDVEPGRTPRTWWVLPLGFVTAVALVSTFLYAVWTLVNASGLLDVLLEFEVGVPFIGPINAEIIVTLLVVALLLWILITYPTMRRPAPPRTGGFPPRGEGDEAEGEPPGRVTVDGRTTLIAKVVPIEVITGWVGIQQVLAVRPDLSLGIQLTFFIGAWLFTPVFMYLSTREEGGKPLVQDRVRAAQILLATITFAIWALTLGAPFDSFELYDEGIATLILLFYTYFVITAVQKL